MAQVSLRWLLQKPYIPSVVIGARTVDQLVDNMGAGTGWELSPDEVILCAKLLNEVCSILYLSIDHSRCQEVIGLGVLPSN